ncbi:MAG: cupin domain-containing protein [Rubrivivax sp.]|nr:cupin domain-containing protein [Rubrivivax sp.]
MRDPFDALLATPDLLADLVEAGLPPPLTRPADAPDAQSDAFAPLLQAIRPTGTRTPDAPDAMRRRLLARVGASAASARSLHTLRLADTVADVPAPGVTQRALYRASAGRTRRPGEPDAVTLVELAPGAAWPMATALPGTRAARSGAPGLQRECLVLRGSLRAGGTLLHVHDYHVVPASADDGPWSSETGALLYLRESRPGGDAPARPTTQRAAAAPWTAYAPGIRRRLMWQQGAQAAMLYHALPGAAVPHHGHRHDEECLMLAGDFFLDEVLLRPLDYQLAPAGTQHHFSCTDTGVLLYAHGDVDLDLL